MTTTTTARSCPRSAGLSVLRLPGGRRPVSLLVHRRSAAVAGVLLAVLAAVMLASACLGQTVVTPYDVWHVVRGGAGPYTLVVGELRVPRIVLGALVGAALGTAGALCRA